MSTALQTKLSRIKRLFLSTLAVAGLTFFMGYQKAHATHVMGADITYRCVDTLKFEFTIKYYRSCKGVSFSNPSSASRIKCATGGGSASV
ncbi:MAG: hypothetical protein KDC76_12685, partial [Bacteroidetes bacterium]|nr:hypothetical protein [Bacteroidota bacterium]